MSLSPWEFTDFSTDVHLNLLFDEFTFREEWTTGSLWVTILASGSVGVFGGLLLLILLLGCGRWFLWLLLLLLLRLLGSLLWSLLGRSSLYLLVLRLLWRSRLSRFLAPLLLLLLLVRLNKLWTPLVRRLDNILPGWWNLLLDSSGRTTGWLLLE